MKGLEQIVQENRKASRNAKLRGLQPYVAVIDGDAGVKACPHIANYKPRGWEISETYFVDSSGFGAENEPALTFGQFLQKVKAGRGYAIKDIGQFQVYINEYVKVGE
jgi:hypothetical protein